MRRPLVSSFVLGLAGLLAVDSRIGTSGPCLDAVEGRRRRRRMLPLGLALAVVALLPEVASATVMIGG